MTYYLVFRCNCYSLTVSINPSLSLGYPSPLQKFYIQWLSNHAPPLSFYLFPGSGFGFWCFCNRLSLISGHLTLSVTLNFWSRWTFCIHLLSIGMQRHPCLYTVLGIGSKASRILSKQSLYLNWVISPAPYFVETGPQLHCEALANLALTR